VHLNGTVNSALISRLRSDLRIARFTVGSLDALWGEQAASALFRGQRVPALRELARQESIGRKAGGMPDAAATLAELFMFGMPQLRDEVTAALPALGIEGAIELGLVAVEGGQVRPLIDLRPYEFTDTRGGGHWWITSDLGEVSSGAALRPDHVLGIGGASMTLTGLMIAVPVDTVPVNTVLDLGTGCGIQAMHASRHARRVIATDISDRALWFADLNAQLNEIVSIEFRSGSLFDPVETESFGQIVSNPPFVITPRVEGVPAYEYRDGGMVGDALVAEVIRGMATRLEPGGIAQLLGNWEYRSSEDGLDRVQDWLDSAAEGVALDAWVIERDVQDVASYAETWIRDGGTKPGTRDFDRLYGAWLDDFEDRGVTQVGFGYVLLRRGADAAPRLRRIERLHTALGNNAAGLGEHLASCLAAHDWQAALSDESLGLAALVTSPDVTEERHYWPGDDDPTVITLRQGGGFGRSVEAGTALAALVGACDGELSIRAICAALAELLEVHDAALTAELLPDIRELVSTGILLMPGVQQSAASLAKVRL
jgi:methylase of polypeptide subunit release factors